MFALNHKIVYELFVFDWNTIVCKLFVLDIDI